MSDGQSWASEEMIERADPARNVISWKPRVPKDEELFRRINLLRRAYFTFYAGLIW